NISVMPRAAALIGGTYGEGAGQGMHLKASELPRIKTIFWAYNIVDFAPFLYSKAEVDGRVVPLTGTWLDRRISLPTGESFETGMARLRSWWSVDGSFPDDKAREVAVGRELSRELGIKKGDWLVLGNGGRRIEAAVSGIFESGGDEERGIYAPIELVQELSNLPDAASRVEVSALTTPDNDLARRAALDPKALSMKDMETWYCTAYASSICYQIEEVLTGASARPVRQVAQSEGAILGKTELLMALITLLSLVGSALGITNLVSASVMERSAEIGLMKALGASGLQAALVVLSGILAASLLGAACGYAAGLGFAQAIGRTVFSSWIGFKGTLIPIIAAAAVAVTLAGSIPALRYLLRLRPAQALHGGR
ncbi:MAG: ABC transporter permease, partial [Succinivibrio sp.]